MEPYQSSSLWQTSLGQNGQTEHETQRLTSLRATFNTMRERASALTSKISASFPELTIHDATHLDALWETASLIAGDGYPLNPMEGFVLGGAILLHDAALCFEAYNGGKDELRSTVQWKDYRAAIEQDRPYLDDIDAVKEADFSTVRTLHARQAEYLGVQGWETPNGDVLYLIQDDELRKFYGRLIGQIAASHHWSHDELQKLSKQANSPGTYPLDWRVDPIKIACLLRCADAAHIDSRRAPDFLNALTKREGVSANHWKAQNWLARADMDMSDPDHQTLLISSNHGFTKDDAAAWWVAYDALCLIDDELRAAASLLAKRPQVSVSPPFALRRVAGANSPEAASEYLEVTDWTPCSAKIHVGNVERLVKDLGGEKLYGSSNKLLVTIRELIQNSRDAINARRQFDSDFDGRVRIHLRTISNGDFEICVADDGIGMSERVLTGPLLDFGTSFWTSNLAQEELPGIRSSKFKPAGRYGIGFYSIFMSAKSVKVSSRKWSDGHNEIHNLYFPNGLSLRPILSTGKPDNFSPQNSTETRIIIDKGFNPKVHQDNGGNLNKPIPMSLRDCIELICLGTDVNVEYCEEDGVFEIVHYSISINKNNEQNCKTVYSALSKLEKFNSEFENDNLLKNLSRARPIIVEGRIIGFAAINIDTINSNYLSRVTVSGFSGDLWRRVSEHHIGYFDSDPDSAQRISGTIDRNTSPLTHWAKEQSEILKNGSYNPSELYVASSALSSFKYYDPEILYAPIAFGNNIKILKLDEIIQSIKDCGCIAFYRSTIGPFIDTYHKHLGYKDYPTFLPFAYGSFVQLEIEGSNFTTEYSFSFLMQNELNKRGCKTDISIYKKAVEGRLSFMDIVLLHII